MFLLLQLYLKKFASLGSQNTVRGIPVREWGACFYDDAGKATVKLTMSFSSTASSSKSCHDMLTGVSDYIHLHHRFPRNFWEKALEYYKSLVLNYKGSLFSAEARKRVRLLRGEKLPEDEEKSDQ